MFAAREIPISQLTMLLIYARKYSAWSAALLLCLAPHRVPLNRVLVRLGAATPGSVLYFSFLLPYFCSVFFFSFYFDVARLYPAIVFSPCLGGYALVAVTWLRAVGVLNGNEVKNNMSGGRGWKTESRLQISW